MSNYLVLGPPPSQVASYLGGNLNFTNYYNTEQPWLSVLHQCGNWSTRNGSNGETNEEGYLQLDSDGIPTSMTASPAVPGGQKFTQLLLLILNGMQTPAGAPYPYPPGSGSNGTYTFTLQGAGAVQFTGDFGNIVSVSPSAYLSGVGTQNLVSTLPSGQTGYVTVTLTTPTASPGMQLILKATDPLNVGNYLKPLGMVESALQPLWLAGGPNAVCHPSFLATVNPLQALRVKDWQQTDNEALSFSVAGGSIAAGSTSTTMVSGGADYNWPDATVSRKVYFTDGEIRTAVFTLGSPTVDWSADPSGGLTNTVTGTYGNDTNWYCQFSILWHDNFAQRSLPSNLTWSSVMGVPLEVICAVSNLIGADCYTSHSLGVTDADAASVANLMINGTGMQSGWSSLANPLLWRWEISNEWWNGGSYKFFHYAGAWGGQLWPSQPAGGGNSAWASNYRGMRTAVVAELTKTALGGSVFNARCYPTLNCQAASAGGDATTPMSTPYWTSAIDGYTGPASNHPIRHISIAPYMGNGLPDSFTNISGITLGSTTIVQINSTTASNPYTTGTRVFLSGINGTTQLNGVSSLVTAIGGTSGAWTVTLNINSSSDTPWISGGSVSSGGAPSWADASTILSQPDGGLSYFFQCFSSNVMTGGTAPGTLSSIPTGGWLGQTLGWIAGWVTKMASYPGVTLLGYEGGTQFATNSAASSNPTLANAWLTLMTNAESDDRMETVYLQWINNWANTVGTGQANGLHFLHTVTPCNEYGDEGVLQSTMQPISPLSSAPPKFRATQAYIYG